VTGLVEVTYSIAARGAFTIQRTRLTSFLFGALSVSTATAEYRPLHQEEKGGKLIPPKYREFTEIRASRRRDKRELPGILPFPFFAGLIHEPLNTSTGTQTIHFHAYVFLRSYQLHNGRLSSFRNERTRACHQVRRKTHGPWVASISNPVIILIVLSLITHPWAIVLQVMLAVPISIQELRRRTIRGACDRNASMDYQGSI